MLVRRPLMRFRPALQDGLGHLTDKGNDESRGTLQRGDDYFGVVHKSFQRENRDTEIT